MMAIEAKHADHPNSVVEKSAVAARQGIISGRVFLVLTTSTLLAIAALGAAFLFVH
jgi:hypothetical protein